MAIIDLDHQLLVDQDILLNIKTYEIVSRNYF